MTGEEPFLRAVIAHPDEDGPRLTFADWLDEQGDPWGQFIRLQGQLAGQPNYRPADGGNVDLQGIQYTPPPIYDLIQDGNRLLTQHCPDWLHRCVRVVQPRATVQDWLPCPGELVWWRKQSSSPQSVAQTRLFWWRGFPERASMTPGQWNSAHEEYMGALPLWYLRVSQTLSRRQDPGPCLETVERYAGRLTTLDLPGWNPMNGFSAQVQAWFDRVGAKCKSGVFTLGIGQPVMSPTLGDYRARWQGVVDSAAASNVKIVCILQPRDPAEDVFRFEGVETLTVEAAPRRGRR